MRKSSPPVPRPLAAAGMLGTMLVVYPLQELLTAIPQIFDEIRRRYRVDPEFRATVDRYVQEFERLLAGLGEDGNSEAVAKTYLLSETGKVYTLLAHAAGKLG